MSLGSFFLFCADETNPIMRNILNLEDDIMGTEKTLKYTGMVLSIIGLGINLATGILDEKKLDMKIAKEVSKHINKK